MKLVGSILLLFAASTISLDLLGHGSDLLVLMDRWGKETGQVIRICIGICGFILLRLPKGESPAEVEARTRHLRPHTDNDADPMGELRNGPAE